MTVYIDDMYRYPLGRFKRMKMSHMIAHTDAELHAFARKLGLRREWFQGDHYDVSLSVRRRAIELGAVAIEMRVLACMVVQRRSGKKLPTPKQAKRLLGERYVDNKSKPLPRVRLQRNINHG